MRRLAAVRNWLGWYPHTAPAPDPPPEYDEWEHIPRRDLASMRAATDRADVAAHFPMFAERAVDIPWLWAELALAAALARLEDR